MRKRGIGLELTIRKSNRVRVTHEKKSVGVRVDNETRSDRVGVHNEKER